MGDERERGTDTETAPNGEMPGRPSGQAAEPRPCDPPTLAPPSRVAEILTPERFAAIFPRVPLIAQPWCWESIVDACARYGIVEPEHLAAALAQWSHETMGLRYLAELWGPTPQQIKYDPPHELAKRLGNMLPGDGFRYRGRGLAMLTGLDNYRQAQREFREPLVDDPDRVARWPLAALTGAWFFRKHNLLGLDFEAQTRRLNGGLTGLPDRLAKWASVRAVLGLS